MQENKRYSAYTGGTRIDADSIIRDILREWWVILLVAVSAALLTGAYKKFTYSPQYVANTTFAVGKTGFSNNLAYDNLNSAKNVTTQFTQVAESNVLKKRVCEQLGLSYFDAQVSVKAVESSNLMTMTVTASSPENAYKISHAVMENTREVTQELMDSVAVKVIQEPRVPVAPGNILNTRGYMKKAALVAAAFMMVLLCVLSYFKDTVKNAEEAIEKLDTKFLGSICHERKYIAGKDKNSKKERIKDKNAKKEIVLNIENPALSFDYVEAIRMITTRVRSAMERKGAKVLLVTSVSENEGKSTVAANLALALTQEEKSVVLMDCDFRNPSQSKIFGVTEEELGEHDFAANILKGQPVEMLKRGVEEKVSLLCSIQPHQKLLNNKTVGRLRTVIDDLKKNTDYIIIDTSPLALVSDGEVIAGLADASIVVVQQDRMEAKYINDALDQLNKTETKVLGCVLNNVRAGILSKTRDYGHYYGGYGSYGGHGYYSHYGSKRSHKGKQVQE